MRRLGSAAFACLALACTPAPPEPPGKPALVALDVLQGFAAPLPREESLRAVAFVDATQSMSRRDPSGVLYLDAARASARRWLADLPDGASVELRAVGGDRGGSCGGPARPLARPGPASDAAVRIALDGLAPLGQGSLAAALFDLAEAQAGPVATPARVVAWTALDDGCEASLCGAADALARRGMRLDLVVLGPAPAPDCLAEVELPTLPFTPPPARKPVGFCVERAGANSAVWGCSESGGLPVATPFNAARVVVRLDPPLVVERSFPPDTRWVLEVVDFPALGAGERQWRWRAMGGTLPSGATR
ncbi:MAG TPA: hypothetical protein VMS55_07585 [Myxococcota bacterium]|nr:hypothetical protein [Myxococcota bacterium]